MLGSITFGNNYIEIVPVVTKEQQARKKRSVDSDGNSGAPRSEPDDYLRQFDAAENTHLIEINEYPEFTWAQPLRAGKLWKPIYSNQGILFELF